MLGAIESVKKGMPRIAAADSHGVPLSTLKDRFNGRVVHFVWKTRRDVKMHCRVVPTEE